MFLFIRVKKSNGQTYTNLNTSHVLIYPVALLVSSSAVSAFKYISCSYLSEMPLFREVGYAEFKYISCSYLSYKKEIEDNPFLNLNTSHVLIYLGFLVSQIT